MSVNQYTARSKHDAPLAPLLGRGGSAARLVPLSEERPLVLVAPLTIGLGLGEHRTWEEVVDLAAGETKQVQVQIDVGERVVGSLKQIVKVPVGAQVTIFQRVNVAAQASWRHEIFVEGEGEVIIRRQVDLQGEASVAMLLCKARMFALGNLSLSDAVFSLAPKTECDVLTKVVLREAAKSQVRGRIVVSDKSTKSIAYERLDHLLIGEEVRAVAIPELEVKTDDVKCGHGATTSRPQASEVFYLMSRGLSLTESEQVIEDGFLFS